jgi:hypothetical protein
MLLNNLAEVHRILEIHEELTGPGPGYRPNVGVLNKSAIVLLVACWEAYIEDLAKTAFDFLLSRAKSHDLFPNKVLTEASKKLRNAIDQRTVWRLAGEGWKKVLTEHKEDALKRYIGKLNTPKPDQVNELFEELLGMRSMSSNWHWPGCSVDKATKKLEELVALRGAIAHRVKTSRKVYKRSVERYVKFINRIAMETSNATRQVLLERTKRAPWQFYSW